MLYIAIALLLLGSAACFGLSSTIDTRRVGFTAAALCALAGLLLLADPPTALRVPDQTLLEIGSASFVLLGSLDVSGRILGVALLGAGALSLTALAAPIAATVRGFGSIFGWSLLTLTAALLSLASPPLSLLTPTLWAVATITGYAALRASGALRNTQAAPHGLALGLLAALLLIGALLGGLNKLGFGQQAPPTAALYALIGILAISGAAPFHSARNEMVAAPAPLGALLYGIIGPTLGLGFLQRGLALLPAMPATWALILAGIGTLGYLGSAAGSLGTERLRPLLSLIAGAQASAILVAAGLNGPLAALAGPTLLVTMILSTAAGGAAVSDLERNTGSDIYTSSEPGPQLRLAGLLWALTGAAALGLPPFLSFWGQRWLLESVLDQQPWLLPLLPAGAILLALAIAAPLLRFWAAADPRRPTAAPGRIDLAAGLLALAPPLLFGIAPQLAWPIWLNKLHSAPQTLPVSIGAQAGAIAAGLVGTLLAVLVAHSTPAREIEAESQHERARVAPQGLGAALAPLAWISNPEWLLNGLWDLLSISSRFLRVLVGLFEQRYYLLGVLVALVTIMLLMAQ